MNTIKNKNCQHKNLNNSEKNYYKHEINNSTVWYLALKLLKDSKNLNIYKFKHISPNKIRSIEDYFSCADFMSKIAFTRRNEKFQEKPFTLGFRKFMEKLGIKNLSVFQRIHSYFKDLNAFLILNRYVKGERFEYIFQYDILMEIKSELAILALKRGKKVIHTYSFTNNVLSTIETAENDIYLRDTGTRYSSIEEYKNNNKESIQQKEKNVFFEEYVDKNNGKEKLIEKVLKRHIGKITKSQAERCFYSFRSYHKSYKHQLHWWRKLWYEQVNSYVSRIIQQLKVEEILPISWKSGKIPLNEYQNHLPDRIVRQIQNDMRKHTSCAEVIIPSVSYINHVWQRFKTKCFEAKMAIQDVALQITKMIRLDKLSLETLMMLGFYDNEKEFLELYKSKY